MNHPVQDAILEGGSTNPSISQSTTNSRTKFPRREPRHVPMERIALGKPLIAKRKKTCPPSHDKADKTNVRQTRKVLQSRKFVVQIQLSGNTTLPVQ